MPTLRCLLASTRGSRRPLVIGALLLVTTNALALSIPWLLRGAVDELGRVQPDRTVLLRVALTIVVVAVVQAMIRTASRWAILGASRRIVARLRERYFAHLQRLDAAFYDQARTGDLMSRGVQDLALLRAVYGPGVLNLLNTVLVYAATLTLMAWLDLSLTLISVALYPPLLLAVRRLNRAAYERGLELQQLVGRLSARAQENLSGIHQVKVFAQEGREIEAFDRLSREYRSRSLALTLAHGSMLGLIGVAAGAATLVVIYVGGLAVTAGRITLGELVAFNAYLALLAWPTVAFGWILNVLQRGSGAFDRIDEVLGREPRIAPPGVAGSNPVALAGPIELRALDFSYGDGPRVLDSIELTIGAGETLAVVGGVGAGKSTLGAILARCHAVPDGTLFWGGVDANQLPTESWRQAVGWVPQEGFLFSRSLTENIAIGRPAVDRLRIERAVRDARLEPDLARFEAGLDTMVGERGITLSGGQRQRAALARALAGEPQLLVLDDALASVDADTEQAILDALQARRSGMTVLISHRLATVLRADRAVVLENGRIVEVGEPRALLAAGGRLAALLRRRAAEDRLESAP